jgi:hypothetical protein
MHSPRNLDQQSHRGLLLPEEGLESSATLPANRCHFDDTAVRINRHDRYDATIGKKNIIERAIGVQQDLTVLAGNPGGLELPSRAEHNAIGREQRISPCPSSANVFRKLCGLK